ncbi:NAD(P)H-dependent oxidoreductase [Rhizobium calliandrae]|uniref:FMN dependent NADH:quinone oxidoreductase n=1 Tax=Rhizobium calliandrae TaxID=1312182 RepID=A0ABT7KEF4_9HYPH|nr:NAD(P)H-dependent oxidoreductase [Rhizobium calliandrae]MDL2406992.1 NAD(P)H-dependent oxidoreductase [Rhizobium calliandrae]
MNILHIDSSARQKSHSRELSAAIVEKLLEVAPGASITRRDLGAEPLPHTEAQYAAALASPATLAAPPKGSLDVSEKLIQEVEAADVIVIGTPMHNFTVPSVVKAWIDQILRVGRTMTSTPAGKVGMLRDHPVFIGVASGGVFTGDRANQPDFLTPYLSLALSSIGLKTQQFLPLQATAFLDWDQASLAREKVLAALDLTVVTELQACTAAQPSCRAPAAPNAVPPALESVARRAPQS